MFAKYGKTNIKPRIKYFTLEMSKEDKIKEIRSFLLFYLHGITMSPDYVDSIYTGRILDDRTERIIKSDEFLQWFEEFESVVEYIDYTKNPYGIYKHVREYAHKTGIYHDKQDKPMDMNIVLHADEKNFKMTPEYKQQLEEFNKNIGYYKPNDEDIYNIIVVDHARLLTLEKDYDDRKNIENFSSSYLMPMRDRWDFIPVMVQQQAASQESVENMKANRLKPTPDGLGISKNTQQDADTLIGLFAPSRHNILSWERYDISKLKDSHRELSILLNRRGNSVTTQLYFNGAANFFKELPRVTEMSEVLYDKIQKHEINPKDVWT